MKIFYFCMVTLLTLFLHPVEAKSCQNDLPQQTDIHNKIIKTAFINQKYEDNHLNAIMGTFYDNNEILENFELNTIKLEKGRRFIVVSDRNLSSESISGIPVVFESVQKEYLDYNKKPSKVCFKGIVEKTSKPKLAGKSGTVKVKLEKITIDQVTYPVEAVISKIDNKKVYFNTLAGTAMYGANLADTASNGTIHTSLKDPCGNMICTTANSYQKPFIFAGAAAVLAADLLISPISSLFKTGNEVSIPQNTLFEIKLDKDMYVLDF